VFSGLSFALMSATAVGVSMISDVLEDNGWSAGKILKVWLVGWNRNIIIEDISGNTDIKLKPPEREGWFFKNTSE